VGVSVLSFFVRQKLSIQSDDDTIAFRIFSSFYLHVEIDRAHDAVAEFIVDKRFHRRPVYLDQFVEPLNRRIYPHGKA
jgi:hypothetical protein